ncbi:hypothetical protein BB560_002861 [Smittium megazygosporum]|uniref:NADH-cytochrome b5 reductase n=1 Tax=Smittium megazygosporum TaxID=133381 RepID=A0A2T9ZDL3_9FUNG|nr:hypothetical protein BB560_002861 [Smittium megazygosporum]
MFRNSVNVSLHPLYHVPIFQNLHLNPDTKGQGKGNGLAFAAAVTAGVLIGGYFYSRGKETAPVKTSSVPATVSSAMNPNDFIPFKLVEIVPLSHNTSVFRFKLGEDQTSGMSVASCLLTMLPPQKEGDKPVVRPYTPITDETTKGHMDLLIKAYPTGVMSKHIHSLKVGDELLIKGPIPKYKYEPNMKKEIGMVAGGTGITPMLQIIDHIAKNPEDKTKVTLLFANVTEGDILLRDHLDKLQKEYPEKFAVHYALDNPPAGWSGVSGRVTADLLREKLPSPSLGEDTVIFVCGPPGMMEVVSGNKTSPADQGEVKGILKDLGYDGKNVYKF